MAALSDRIVEPIAETTGWVISSLQRVAGMIAGHDGRCLSSNELDSCIVTLEKVYRELLVRECTQGLTSDGKAGLEYIRMALNILEELREVNGCHFVAQPQTEVTGSVGRPRFLVHFDQLESLVESHFTVPQIAAIIGVSPRTIHRRMTEFGLSISTQYAEITDEHLDDMVCRIQHDFPTCGNRQMHGHLLALGLRVQQYRIREAQRRTDPNGSLLRQLSTVNRRKYRVAGPRALYHIDGNHKLIRLVYNCPVL